MRRGTTPIMNEETRQQIDQLAQTVAQQSAEIQNLNQRLAAQTIGGTQDINATPDRLTQLLSRNEESSLIGKVANVGKPKEFSGKDWDEWDFVLRGWVGNQSERFKILMTTAKSQTIPIGLPQSEQDRKISATLFSILTMLCSAHFSSTKLVVSPAIRWSVPLSCLWV